MSRCFGGLITGWFVEVNVDRKEWGQQVNGIALLAASIGAARTESR